MATIPMGQGRRQMPGRAPASGSSAAEFGMASARALEGLGNTAAGIGVDMIAQQTRLDQQEAQRQAAQREAADRQRDQLALQQTEDALRDAHDEVATGIGQGTVPKEEAEKAWSERSSKVVGEALPNFRDQSKELARRSLEGLGLRLGNSVRKVREKQDKNDVTAGITQSLEYLQRQYKTDPVAAEKQAMATLQQLGPFSNFTPDQLAKMGQGWREGVQFTTAYEAVSLGRNDRQALAAAEKLIGKLPDLDPQKRAQLMDRAQAYRLSLDQQAELRAARVEREADRRLKKAEAEFNTFQGLADKGTQLAPEYIDRAISATAGTPYQAGIVALARQAKETGGLAAQPVAVQRRALDALDAQIAQAGRTPELDKRREQLQKVLAGSESDLRDDPLRAGLERGVIEQLPPLNMQGGIPGLVQQLQERGVQADRVQAWAGRPVAPLTSQEAQVFGQQLKSMPVDQRATAIQTIAAVIPPQQGQALAALLDKQDRPTAIALGLGMARTSFDRPTAELVLKGAEALKAKTIKEEKTPVDGWMGRINTAMSTVYMNPQQAEMAAEAARYILAGKVVEGATGSDSDVRTAIRLAVGGTLLEHNGQRIVLPAGVERKTFDQRMQSYPAAELAQQLPDGKVYVRGQPMEATQFLAGLPGAQLRTVGRGRYAVMAGGTVATNERGQPVLIEVPNAR